MAIEPGDYEAVLAMQYIGDRLADPRVEAHFTKNRHKQAATRELLDLFGVPLPDWARRNLSGAAAASKATMDRFRGDNPDEAFRHRYPDYVPRKGS